MTPHLYVATGRLDKAERLPQEFVLLDEGEEHGERFPLDGTLQVMDDCGSNLSFDEVNIYSSKTITETRNSELELIQQTAQQREH